MASKLEYYSRMAEDTAADLTKSREQWTAFLRTAGRVSKYAYGDQLMIFAQRPEATACAEYDLWNNTMRRYVKRGSKGIALIDNSGDYPRLRYVFDVADTGARRNSRPVNLWQMREEYERPVQEALAAVFEVSARDPLDVQVENIANWLAMLSSRNLIPPRSRRTFSGKNTASAVTAGRSRISVTALKTMTARGSSWKRTDVQPSH